MKGIAVTDIGLEWASQREVKDILGKKSSAIRGAVKFEADRFEDICNLVVNAQSITGAGLFVSSFAFKGFDDLKKKMKKGIEDFDFKDWLDKGTKFRISCDREGNHEFASKEVEEEAGGFLISHIEKSLGFEPSVSLENPDFILKILVMDDEASIYIDFAGRDLSKRDYKLYSHPTSLRGNIAFAAVLESGYKGKGKLLDPFAGSGMIPIEACFYAQGKSVHSEDGFAFQNLKPLKEFDIDSFKEEKEGKIDVCAFDKSVRSLRYGRNNAKIAGVEDNIKFSNSGISWLDTKFGEEEVDYVVTQPPELTNRSKPDEIRKIYDEMFYQCRYILSGKGILVILARKTEIYEEICGKHGFKLEESKALKIGDESYHILKFLKHAKA